MSRWADEFETEILAQTPRAISAISAIRSDSRAKTVLMAPNGANGTGKSDQETQSHRLHCIVLLGQPYPDEPDNNDPAEGERIIATVESAGGWLRLWDGRIVFRWRGDIPNAGELIDRIRAARTAVVLAVRNLQART